MTTPAPDVTGYVDLTLLDVDTQALVDRARAALEVIFPDWTPGEWNTEAVLLEAFALEVAELVYAINRLPGTLTEVLLRLFALERDAGVAPRALVTFATSNVGAMSIPAGTRVTLNPGGGLEPLDFLTDVELAVDAGETEDTVRATAIEPTARVNVAVAGTPVEVVDAVAYVDSATINVDVPGRSPEDALAFLNRGVSRLRRLVTTLVLDDQFRDAVLEDPRVTQALTLDRYNPAVGPAPGDNLGHVTVVVAGVGGAALDAGVKTELESALEAQAVAGLDVHVIDATVTAVDVDVTVTAVPSTDPAELEAAIIAALEAYLDPDRWTFGALVYVNELIPLIDALPGVERVVDLTLSGTTLDADGNAELAGFGPLADLGVPTVTIEA